MAGLNSALKEQEAEVDKQIQALAAGQAPEGETIPDQTQSADTGTPEQQTPVQETQKETHEDEELAYKQRYSALVGKYNAEVPRLQAQIKQLQANQGDPAKDARIAQLEAQVAQLSAQPQAQAPLVQSANLEKLRLDYGADLVDGLVGLVSQSTQQQVAPLTQQIDTVAQNNAESNFEAFKGIVATTLAQQNINFVEYDNDPLFLAWLNEPLHPLDPGRTRKMAMNDAISARDVSAASNFFIEYKASLGPGSQASVLESQVQVQDGGAPPQQQAERPAFDPVKYQEMSRQLLNKEITQEQFKNWERDNWPRSAQQVT